MLVFKADLHGEFGKLSEYNFPIQKTMTKDDYVIIGGDFGVIWKRNENDISENEKLDYLESLPFTLLFVDGNHENFDRLKAYPVETWNGGKVHKIRSNIIHLMRGQVFNLNGVKIFTFGGARSHDISGGIVELDDPDFWETINRLEYGWKPYRINHLSWWKEEMPSEEEMEEGMNNLEKHNFEVDLVVTHCCPTSTQYLLAREIGREFEPDELTNYFEKVRQKLKFKKWICGHYHVDISLNSESLFLYEESVVIK